MQKAVLYARTATVQPTNKKRDPNITGQVRSLKRYAEKQQMEIVGIYADSGKSGANLIRPELQRMLKDAKKHKFDVVLAEDVARLSRNIMDCCILKKELQNASVQIQYLNPSARLVDDIMTLMDRHYEYARSEAIKAGMRKRSKKAKRPIAGKQKSLLAAKS